MTPRRKKIVQALRQEGRAAFEAGKNPQSCPHLYMDRMQWLQGWMDACDEHELQQEGTNA